MFKIFVLCSLLVSISCWPSHHQGVEQVAVAVENEEKPQPFPVSVEQVLKASPSQTEEVVSPKEEEPINESLLKSDEPVVANAPVVADPPAVKSENSEVALKSAEEEEADKNRFLLLWALKKTTTTVATTAAATTAAATTMPTTMAPTTMAMMMGRRR